jgi:hypothetical protein
MALRPSRMALPKPSDAEPELRSKPQCHGSHDQFRVLLNALPLSPFKAPVARKS